MFQRRGPTAVNDQSLGLVRVPGTLPLAMFDDRSRPEVTKRN